MLFAPSVHPQRIEVAEFVESRRLPRVAAGQGVGVTVLSPPELISGVVVRPFEEPVPFLEYGIGWYEPHVSPLVAPFLELAEKLAEPVSEMRREARLIG